MKRTLAALLVCAMAMSGLPALAVAPDRAQAEPVTAQRTGENDPSTPAEAGENGALLGNPTVPDAPEDGSLLGKPTVPDAPEDGSLLGKPTVPDSPEDPPQENTPPEPGDGNPPEETPAAVLTQNHVVYLAGFPDRRFQPDQTLTRAQGAQIVYRLLENPTAGTGPCSYTDVPEGQWYAQPVRALCALGLFDDGVRFRPGDIMTRAELVDLLVRLRPDAQGSSSFRDVPADHWAAAQIGAAASLGWINGYADGTFRPDGGLTRAEACAVINRMTGRSGDSAQAAKLLSLGLFPDVGPGHWAGSIVAEAAVAHGHGEGGNGESWSGVDLASLRFTPGFHDVGANFFYVDRSGKLALNGQVGAYTAGPDGALSRTAAGYQMPYVPYYSQIDGIYAWVGCEAVATFGGLQAKGFAGDATLRGFLDNLPRSSSDPEKGFVGSPYVPDSSKRTRTTIYPAKLAEYSNSYTGGANPCADFRGASITDLQRELLAGNCVVGYMTLWWAKPYYRNYNIEGVTQRLVSNNHAVLVCGYDPEKGYFISDPYNYYNRGQVHQYWENAATFESIWNERKVGMVIR